MIPNATASEPMTPVHPVNVHSILMNANGLLLGSKEVVSHFTDADIYAVTAKAPEGKSTKNSQKLELTNTYIIR
jgi:hypothetical protein